MKLEITHTMGSDDIYDIIKHKAVADLKKDLMLAEDAGINIKDHSDKFLNFFGKRCEEYVFKLHAAKAKHKGRSSMSETDIDVKNLTRYIIWELGEDDNEAYFFPSVESDDLPF